MSIKQGDGTVNRVLRQSISLLSVGIVIIGIAACMENTSWADRLNFYDGQIENGHVIEISGDIVRYRKGWFKEFTTNRLKLTDRQDIVTTWGDKQYSGEVHYIDSAKLELLTDTGRQVFWKASVKDIQLGSPKMSQKYFTPASASSMPASRPTAVMPSNMPDHSWDNEPQPAPNFSTPPSEEPFHVGPSDTYEPSKPRVVFPD